MQKKQKEANELAFERMVNADPVLVDVRPAGSVVPGFTRECILTSGAPLPWQQYTGGQRTAILGGAVFEGLARDFEEAEAKILAGEIRLEACHDHACVGSMAGVCTASMPVLVVENRDAGNRAFCTLYEGPQRERLTYGVYNDAVRRNLQWIRDVVAPLLSEAIRTLGGIPLRPIIRRALHMGDELHSRNTAATLLFTRELFPALLEVAKNKQDVCRQVLDFLYRSDLFFLHLSMAAAKAAADAAHGIEGSSVVTAMALSCREFAIRVSGLGNVWFRAPIPKVHARLFEGYSEDDVAYIGGESLITETVGLGGFAQAAAFALQSYSGGSVDEMVNNNLRMYQITVGEHPEFKIPYLGYRGTPTGIDVERVVATGITPVINMGVAHRKGGQAGAGIMHAPIECFVSALEAYRTRYGFAGA